MNARVIAKQRPLGAILVEQGALTPERRQMLDLVTAEHLKAHAGDVQRSLAAVAHRSTLADVAQSLADPDPQASLAAAEVSTVAARPAVAGRLAAAAPPTRCAGGEVDPPAGGPGRAVHSLRAPGSVLRSIRAGREVWRAGFGRFGGDNFGEVLMARCGTLTDEKGVGELLY
jgi:hypothetical protein